MGEKRKQGSYQVACYKVGKRLEDRKENIDTLPNSLTSKAMSFQVVTIEIGSYHKGMGQWRNSVGDMCRLLEIGEARNWRPQQLVCYRIEDETGTLGL